MPYFTYVIKSESTGKIYIGQTNNLETRLGRHNRVKNGSYTTLNKGPWKIIYHEQFNTRKEAMLREKQLKSHQGRDWLRSTLNLSRELP